MVPSDVAAFQTALVEALDLGLTTEERIDEAVRRILRVKFEMGLFDTPMPGADLVGQVGSDDHRALARRAVAASLVLLETERDVLPLDPGADLLVAGRAADDIGIQSGGWTIGWQGRPGDITDGTTVLEGLDLAMAGEVAYDPQAEFEEGVSASIGVAVVGESPYAEGVGDSPTLSLPQSELVVIERLRERVDRLVVVVVTGRPLVLGPTFDLADALLVAWLPGTEGSGVADVLTGAVPVSGITPYTWPLSVDDAPRTGKEACAGARYPVGYGLDLGGADLGTPRCPAP
jgi:beta-glucosidase